MKTKRKLFVRFFHESILELPLIFELSMDGRQQEEPFYQSRTLGYIKTKQIVPVLNSKRNVKILSNLARKGRILEKPVPDDPNASNLLNCILKPNYFSFLERRLDNGGNLHEANDDGTEDNLDLEVTCAEKNIKCKPLDTDFLSWLEVKFDKKTDDLSTEVVINHKKVEVDIGSNNVCMLCGKTYTSKNGLIYHMNLHRGVLSYQCKLCLKKFKSSSTLHRHVKSVHEGRKPLKCEVCEKRFHQRSNLNKHLDSHYGIRKFKCRLCPKTFFQKCHLNTHLAAHTGKKHFACTICSKHFAKKFCLDRHVQKIHDLG